MTGDDSTRLEPDDADGLLLRDITTHGQLNDAEAANIRSARTWLRSTTPTPTVILDDAFLRSVHRRMFCDVWSWAGTYRRSATNLGIDWQQVPVAVRNLVADTLVRIDHDDADTVAVGLHQALVSIHPFPNGNGRHARLCADILAAALGRPSFTWGKVGGRERYIELVRAVERDASRLPDLVAFARS